MTDERRLLASGMPLLDAITMCHDLRREGTLSKFLREEESKRVCKCGGDGSCPDCPSERK